MSSYYSQINNYNQIKEKILIAVEEFCQPIIKTLTPMGSNVICQTEDEGYFLTNDGITIAKQINFKDKVKDAVAQFLKSAAMKTNYEVGDGTSTTILLARAFIKEGFKLIDAGWNSMELARTLNKQSQIILNEIDKLSLKIKDDNDLLNVARIASNNDEEIAENVVKAVKAAGQDGIILQEPNTKDETEMQTEEGFLLDSGMFSPQLSNVQGKLLAQYQNTPDNPFKILVIDKRIYYPEEAIAILDVPFKVGIKNIIIVASDFIGTAPNAFITNHIRKNMSILLVKAKEEDLEDLADYLGIEVISEKKGRLSTSLTIEDFGEAKRVLADMKKTLILTEKGRRTDDKNDILEHKINELKDIIKKEKDEKEKEKLQKRLARMTSGTVTLYVGGKTAPEMREKMFRYEDSINAVRAAQREGIVVGGGLTLYKASLNAPLMGDLQGLMAKICKAPLEQIAINCDLHFPTLLAEVNKGEGQIMGMKVAGNWRGWNAAKCCYEDLFEAGILEPSSVIKSAFKNGLSSALTILSSNFIITLIKEEDEKDIKE